MIINIHIIKLEIKVITIIRVKTNPSILKEKLSWIERDLFLLINNYLKHKKISFQK